LSQTRSSPPPYTLLLHDALPIYTLQAKLTGAERHAISMQPTQNTEAYQLYLRGRYFWNKRTGPDLQKAIDYFKQAIDKDPNYARSEEHTSELQSHLNLVCRLLLE